MTHQELVVSMQNEINALTASNRRLYATLEDIWTTAHCIAKAGPLHTKTLDEAWQKFTQLSVMAARGLCVLSGSTRTDSGEGQEPPSHC